MNAEQLAKQAVRRLLRPRSFPSWRAARENAGNYGDEALNRFRVACSLANPPDGSVLERNLLGLVLHLAGRGDVRITDLGGGTGELGADVLRFYPDAHYTVVENETLVGMLAGQSALQFTSALPAHCDIFFTSGTLQYLDDPMAMLEAGFRSASQLAVLVRNSFADRELFHVQKSLLSNNIAGNVPPELADRTISYPHRSLVETDVVRLAGECGLECIVRLDEESGALFGQYGRQLVFARR